MRINKYIAQASLLSRRAADAAIAEGRVRLNGKRPAAGDEVGPNDSVTLDNRPITPAVKPVTIMLNKPVGYVCSRNGQGSETIYTLVPPELQRLNPVGRLDKNSSGLLLMTNDGTLANDLTHPSRKKTKLYEVTLDKPLQPLHQQMITDHGITLDDGPSQFVISKIEDVRSTAAERSEAGEGEAGRERSDAPPSEGQAPPQKNIIRLLRRGKPLLKKDSSVPNESTDVYHITMHEGRNRQIRRTFAALGYTVTSLHRTQFGPYRLDELAPGAYLEI